MLISVLLQLQASNQPMWCIAVRNPIKLIFPLLSQISGCAGLNGHLVSDDSARIDRLYERTSMQHHKRSIEFYKERSFS